MASWCSNLKLTKQFDLGQSRQWRNIVFRPMRVVFCPSTILLVWETSIVKWLRKATRHDSNCWVVTRDMQRLRLTPQELHVKSNTNVRSAVHSQSRSQWKAPFRRQDSGGLHPPTFCNFPKSTNQQPRLLFSGTGQVRIGEKWAELCSTAFAFHCWTAPCSHH